MKTETLIYLLRGEHMNRQDRITQGIWPHAPLRFGEVVSVLADHLERAEWFPGPPVNDGYVHEGGRIERLATGGYRYWWQRSHPSEPEVVAESAERVFGTAEEAARFYLKSDMRLPGDLDGWKVVE